MMVHVGRLCIEFREIYPLPLFKIFQKKKERKLENEIRNEVFGLVAWNFILFTEEIISLSPEQTEIAKWMLGCTMDSPAHAKSSILNFFDCIEDFTVMCSILVTYSSFIEKLWRILCLYLDENWKNQSWSRRNLFRFFQSQLNLFSFDRKVLFFCWK